jgi:hypothetical protein
MDEVAGRHAGRIAVEPLRHAPLPVPVAGSLSRQNIIVCTQLAYRCDAETALSWAIQRDIAYDMIMVCSDPPSWIRMSSWQPFAATVGHPEC